MKSALKIGVRFVIILIAVYLLLWAFTATLGVNQVKKAITKSYVAVGDRTKPDDITFQIICPRPFALNVYIFEKASRGIYYSKAICEKSGTLYVSSSLKKDCDEGYWGHSLEVAVNRQNKSSQRF